jgi:hypothetical protein
MTKLVENSMPAELRRGCVFAEQFESTDMVVANGGTLIGAPTFKNRTATFSGSNEQVTYPSNRLKFESATADFTITFRFRFAAAVTGAQILIDLRDSADDGWSIRVNTNGLFRAQINTVDVATTARYDDGEWHNFAIPFNRSGTSIIYIDGVAAGNAVDTSGNPMNISSATMKLGDIAYGTSGADYIGDMRDLKIWDVALTVQEISDLYTNSTYNWRNKAILDLPMTIELHDPTNFRSLDVSGAGAHAVLGDGDGGDKAPTKLVKHGYDCDGTNDYLESAIDIGQSTAITYVVEFSPHIATDFDDDLNMFNSNDGNYTIRKKDNAGSNDLRIRAGGVTIDNIPNATYTPYWKINQYNIIVCSIANGDSSVWLNGFEVLSNDLAPWVPTTTTALSLMATTEGVGALNGQIYSAMVLPFACTPLQARDIEITLRKKVNDI